MKNYIIAIDGPASSGKSTTAKMLAKSLKYVYIDTGAMYRACGLAALQKNIPLSNIEKLTELLDIIDIKIEYSEEGNKILLFDEDVSKKIREPEITKISSEIAVIDIVRTRMVELQRIMGKNGGVIMDGRDIGTVVFPSADFKFFMIADVDTRAKRRFDELIAKNQQISYEEVKKELIWRDKNDSERKNSPLKQADDAIIIDTTDLTPKQQVSKILSVIGCTK